MTYSSNSIIKSTLNKWYLQNSKIGYENFYSQGAVGLVSGIMHRMMEIGFDSSKKFSVTLELGAGHGQHFRYVRHKYSKYVMSDIRVDNLKNVKKTISTNNVIIKKIDATNLKNVASNSVDRLIITCLLAHLPNPLNVLDEWKRIVKKNGGVITLYIPTEGGLVTQGSRRIFIWPRSRKLIEFDPELICYYEHVNGYLQLRKFIHFVFADCKIKKRRFPFFKLFWQFSLFEIYTIKLGNGFNNEQ
jgi:phosphatidylethanolamine/phosphatidyl-N-methylethanolamine N-methyltransferase